MEICTKLYVPIDIGDTKYSLVYSGDNLLDRH
ncbi:hypothetical protein BOM_0016 [Borrelia miyamotoi FR64b]|nr:hypothetical protein BOM_0016 [Borrelia miyamotoi FR64b]